MEYNAVMAYCDNCIKIKREARDLDSLPDDQHKTNEIHKMLNEIREQGLKPCIEIGCNNEPELPHYICVDCLSMMLATVNLFVLLDNGEVTSS